MSKSTLAPYKFDKKYKSPIDPTITLPVMPSTKQIIHLLSNKASSSDGYEQALNALQGRIVAMTTTSQHLIVVTE